MMKRILLPYTTLACALAAGAGCNALDAPPPGSDPGAVNVAADPTPGPERQPQVVADPFGNAAQGAAGAPAFDAPAPVGAFGPGAFGPGVPDDLGYFDSQLTVASGHLVGSLPGARLDADATITYAYANAWSEPGFSEKSLTLELHAVGSPGAAMVMATLRDVEPLTALLRGPEEDVGTVVSSETDITGCSGAELQNYDWDNSATGVVTAEIDADDSDMVLVSAEVDFGVDGRMVGTAKLDRAELLPVLEELAAF